MNSLTDPKKILDQSPMSTFQIFAIVICILLNALDGFDVLAISFASPGIANEWGINRAALGIVLAMELVGMAVGSILLGGFADKIGRRPTILICLFLMTAGMYFTSQVLTVKQLLILRFITGFGIGGMLASTAAMAAEYANAKYRNLAVILMAAGYPLGAIVGGSISTTLLNLYDWRSIFVFGAICTGAFSIIVCLWLPESIEYLLSKKPRNALWRINNILIKMGHDSLARLASNTNKVEKNSYQILFSKEFRTMTLLMVVAYFMLIMTFYYILKWIPKIVVDMGYDASSAGSILVWANVGGVIGAVLLGLIAERFKLRKLLIIVLVLAFFMVSAFGLGQETLSGLAIVAAMTGFFTNASVVGFYALMANYFPANIRASGTGIVIGVGRGGAALGPIIAGYLFTAGHDLFFVSVLMGAGAMVAALAVFMLGFTMKSQAISSGK